jgi:hypothetical protein
MKLLKRITTSLFAISILGLIFAIMYSGVILEITNNSQATIKDVSINYGRGTYFLPEIKNGETVKNRIGKIGEGANFEITWKYGESNVGNVTYNVYFTDMLSPTRISIIFPDEKSALLEYRGRAYKPYVKSGT